MKQRIQVCAVPGCPELQPAPRCPEHQRELNRHNDNTTPTKVHRAADRARRTATVNKHRETFGDWCPGWQRPPHPSADLTADHINEIALGGDPNGPLQVLCRSCNSRKANPPGQTRHDTPAQQSIVKHKHARQRGGA